ncbi:protein POOR HOMOLOGOUS SYNAPSIS 1 isoform X2 [Argentina anserina]|uniref:protein POOR HOMOLOGOUS SYNAPSIS 1 isoform X2 n=1 Tax=Argentina anserina TaxID=57926 RepID=UPI002176520D|nr:protein POOR HOMOLOGOUS SYNAPSIS 1 isoform X2 [Potentilla anserina]
MAGTLALLPSNPQVTSSSLCSVRERWEVDFSRFFGYPPLTSTCPDLVPLPMKVRNRRPGGTWISATSAAMLQLISDHASSDVILTVCCSGKIQEEHYVSKLLFAWPQVACMSGFPARGSRSVLASYRDSLGQIQKFAFRFLSANEAEKFMKLMKEILKEGRDIQPLTTDYGSEISSHSEFMSSNRPLHGTSKDLVVMTPGHTHSPQISPSLMKAHTPQTSPSLMNDYTPQLSPRWNTEAVQHRQTQQMSPIQNFQSNFAAFPPSFSSLVSNCQPVVEQAPVQSTASKKVDMKALIARCMEDTSFQDILNQVEIVMSEMGADLRL